MPLPAIARALRSLTSFADGPPPPRLALDADSAQVPSIMAKLDLAETALRRHCGPRGAPRVELVLRGAALRALQDPEGPVARRIAGMRAAHPTLRVSVCALSMRSDARCRIRAPQVEETPSGIVRMIALEMEGWQRLRAAA